MRHKYRFDIHYNQFDPSTRALQRPLVWIIKESANHETETKPILILPMVQHATEQKCEGSIGQSLFQHASDGPIGIYHSWDKLKRKVIVWVFVKEVAAGMVVYIMRQSFMRQHFSTIAKSYISQELAMCWTRRMRWTTIKVNGHHRQTGLPLVRVLRENNCFVNVLRQKTFAWSYYKHCAISAIFHISIGMVDKKCCLNSEMSRLSLYRK